MDNSYFNNGYGMGSYTGISPIVSQHISTNVIKVTSLEEAIMQTNRRPCDMVYFNQDKDEFYNVKIDYDGRKTWAVFTYTVPNLDASTPASKADIASLIARVDALEAKVGGVANAESNG